MSGRALIVWEELTVRLRRILALFAMIAAVLGYAASALSLIHI